MTIPSKPHPDDHQSPPSDETNAPLRTIPSDELLRGTREVLIEHLGELYRLRLTRNGKLILQK